MKRSSLGIIEISVKEEIKEKCMDNIFMKIIEENVPNLKEIPIKVQETKKQTEHQIYLTRKKFPQYNNQYPKCT